LFLIRIYLEGPETHNLRKLMHAAGKRQRTSPRLLFIECYTRYFPKLLKYLPLHSVEQIHEGNCDNLCDLCDDRGNKTSRETNI